MQTPLGQKLKAAREKRGLSLLDASHATKIPVQRLHFLEQDNFAGFGSMTYARAFLKVYSHFLGVNAQEMLEDLPEGVLGGTCDYRYLTDSHGHWVVPREQRVSRASGPAQPRQSMRSPVPAGIFIFVLVLAGTGIWGKYVADDRHAQLLQQLAQQKASPKPRPAQSNQSVAIGAATGTQNSGEPATEVKKAMQLTPEEVAQLMTNKIVKAVPVE
jgi:cytoskeletal protein RodZ